MSQAAIDRAMLEELGISTGFYAYPTWGGIETEEKQSPSYPGLSTRYIRHHAHVDLCRSTYNPDGYVETQADKKTFFVWR